MTYVNYTISHYIYWCLLQACQYDPFYYVFWDIGSPDKVTFNYDGGDVTATYTSADDTRYVRSCYIVCRCNHSVYHSYMK